MDSDDVLRAYQDCCDTVFSHPRRFHAKSPVPFFRLPRPKYSQSLLDRMVEKVMSKNVTPTEFNWERESFTAPGDRCRTSVEFPKN